MKQHTEHSKFNRMTVPDAELLHNSNIINQIMYMYCVAFELPQQRIVTVKRLLGMK